MKMIAMIWSALQPMTVTGALTQMEMGGQIQIPDGVYKMVQMLLLLTQHNG